MSNSVPAEKTYQVGTLTYDRRKLVKLFFWLLLGDFAMSVMGVALHKLIPLHLDTLGVKAGSIGSILSLGPLMALILSPFTAVWSDRLRTRWGRRRPILVICTPIIALGIITIPHVQNLALLIFILLIVQICTTLDGVVMYMYADVVPSQFMGRFMAGFRLVSISGALAFTYFLLPHFGVEPMMVWTISGVVYFVLFQLSLYFIREGQYDKPVIESKKEIVTDYLKDGFTSKYIWLLWGAMGMCAIATPATNFIDIFSRKELGLDMKEIAHLNFIATLPALILMLPGGWIMDRFGPRVIWGASTFLFGATFLWAYLFAHDAATIRWLYLINGIIGPIMTLALMPMLYAHLPRVKFGQLTSTQSLVVQSLIFLSSNVVGHVIESQGNIYRIALLYAAPSLMLTPVFVYFLSRAKTPFVGLEPALISKKDAKKRDEELAAAQ